MPLIKLQADGRLPRSQCPRARSSGVSLVEILVTLVVTSVGLLGVAAMQLSTLRNNFDATARTQASVLAADIVDRMRANRTVAMTHGYDITITAPPPTAPTAQAGRDLREWKNTLSVLLPGGQGGVLYDDVTKVVTIAVNWN